MVPVISSITVKGQPLAKQLPPEEIQQLVERTQKGGAEIVKLLKSGSAFYAPASSVVEMAGAMLEDRHAVLPVCTWLEGAYGLRDVYIGVPAQLGAAGVEKVVEIPLSREEHTALSTAASSLSEGMKSLASILATSNP